MKPVWLLGILGVFVAHAQECRTEFRNGWMRPADSGMVTGAFVTIVNSSNRADTITSVRCDCADHAEIHTTVRNSDGTLGMRPIEELVIEAGKTVVLKPRSLHVMLYHVRRSLRAGERCMLVFRSKRCGELRVPLEVRR